MTGEELPRRQVQRDQPAGSGHHRATGGGRIWPASSRFLRPWGNPGLRPKLADSSGNSGSRPEREQPKPDQHQGNVSSSPAASGTEAATSETATSETEATASGEEMATSGIETAASGEKAVTGGEATAASDVAAKTGRAETAASGTEAATSEVNPATGPVETTTSGPKTTTSGTAAVASTTGTAGSRVSGMQVGGAVVEQRVLAQLVLLRNEVAGVDGSLVATSDGLLVVQDLPTLEPNGTAALIATTLSIARQATQLTDRGLLREAVIHGSSGYLAVFAVGESAVLAVLGGDNLNVGMLHYQTRAIVKRIEKEAAQFPRFASTLPERIAGISGRTAGVSD